MNEAQLRERVSALERMVEEKHKELLVLRETVPAKVRRALPHEQHTSVLPAAPAHLMTVGAAPSCCL